MNVKRTLQTVKTGAELALLWAGSYLEIVYGGDDLKNNPLSSGSMRQQVDSPREDDDTDDEEFDPREF